MSVSQGREISNARMRRLLLAIEDVTGSGGLMTMLYQARLHRFTTGLPPEDRALRVHAVEYAAVVQAIETYYGRGARGTLLRVGRATFRHLAAQQRLQAARQRLAFLVEAAPARRGRVLGWLAQELAFPDGRVIVEAGPEGAWALVDYAGDVVFGRTRTEPGCWLTVGVVLEALQWATGREHDVVETACKGLGAPACRFEARPLTP